ncbi:MAG: hypothetical protein IAF94_14755 [Pirellulaceae bacterium]|nr:hypothetical protein [Pirellulaceae bacterium]
MSIVTHEANWEQLCEAEPCLRQLELAILRSHPDLTADGYWPGYEKWKRIAAQFVGWFARRPALRSEAAWNVAHDHLLSVYQSAACNAAQEVAR